MLSIEKKLDKEKALFVLEGSLDASSAPELQGELKESLEGITDLTLDFEKVDYISSAGLRVLLATQKIMNKQGKLTLVKVCGPVMQVFEMTGFTEVLTIDPDKAGEEKEEK